MKTISILLLFSILFAACEKEAAEDKLQYGCQYGINKATGEREFIKCAPHDICIAGYNQDAANAMADDMGIDRIDVSDVKNYTDLEFELNPKCDCEL